MEYFTLLGASKTYHENEYEPESHCMYRRPTNF
jgi:hypothetical protein